MSKIAYTKTLMRVSWENLKRDKEIIVFPVLALALCVAVTLSWGIGFDALFGHPTGESAAATLNVGVDGTSEPPSSFSDRTLEVAAFVGFAAYVFLFFLGNAFVLFMVMSVASESY
ncbi:MAG: hypothetical protein AB1733_25140 [Thermodesulfobacteriota bacterium]